MASTTRTRASSCQCEAIRGAITSFIEDVNLIPSDINTRAKEFAANFLAKAMETVDMFDKFCSLLENEIESIFLSVPKRIRSHTVKRTQLWSAFHVKTEEMSKLWINELKLKESSSEGPHVNFFIQSINQSLFGEKLKRFMAQECPLPVKGESNDQLPKLTKDELNAMQYVGGYVPHKLLKKYEKRSGTKYSQFIECLGNMAVVNEESSQDLLSYTKCWMEKVNRGALFPLNDRSFCLFVEMEKITKSVLPTYVIGKGTMEYRYANAG